MKHNKNKSNLYDSIKELIENAKSNIVRNVNSIVVYTHFEIGKKDKLSKNQLMH